MMCVMGVDDDVMYVYVVGGNRDYDDVLDEVVECLVSEEYKIWKKNILFLYDFVVMYVFEWLLFMV